MNSRVLCVFAGFTIVACGGTSTPPAAPATESPAPAASSAEPVAAEAPSAAPAKSAEPPQVPAEVADADFEAPNYTGSKKLYFNDISCKSSGALKPGLTALGNIASGFEAKADEVKACFGKEVKPRIGFTVSGGKMTKVLVSGADAKIAECVGKALENASSKAPDATCALTFSHD